MPTPEPGRIVVVQPHGNQQTAKQRIRRAVDVDFTRFVAHLDAHRDAVEGPFVHESVARRLFREPIERGDGLGIGLYHAARQAATAGYAVELATNRDGDVCFALVRAPASA